MKQRQHLFAVKASVLLLAASAIVPRIPAGTIGIVKYDILSPYSGGGYATVGTALLAKATAALLFVSSGALACIFRRRWFVWTSVMLLSVPVFLTISDMSETDVLTATRNGQVLIDRVEAFHREHGRFPASAEQIGGIPRTGLAPIRRFVYVTPGSPVSDPYLPARIADRMLGDCRYAVVLSLVPGGTLVYRPTHDYSDISSRGRPFGNGWFRSNID